MFRIFWAVFLIFSLLLIFTCKDEKKEALRKEGETKKVETIAYPFPPDNAPTPERILLGKTLFLIRFFPVPIGLVVPLVIIRVLLGQTG